MSDKEIDYYYTMSSPWTYLGHEPFVAMASRAGVRIRHKPIDLGSVFEISGGLPLPKRAIQRQHYRLYELQRWRKFRNAPLNLQPKFFPVDAGPANRLLLAVQRLGGDADGLAGRLMRAVWAEERNIADRETLAAIARDAGLEADRAMEAAESEATREEYARLTEEAKQREVFGAPTYYYRGEPFWGQDRLDFVERALKGDTEPVTLP